jgi:hypothetical protein
MINENVPCEMTTQLISQSKHVLIKLVTATPHEEKIDTHRPSDVEGELERLWRLVTVEPERVCAEHGRDVLAKGARRRVVNVGLVMLEANAELCATHVRTTPRRRAVARATSAVDVCPEIVVEAS